MEQNLKISQSKLLPQGKQIEQQFQDQLSSLKATVDTQYYKPKHIGLGRYKPTSDKYIDYQTYFPTDYYSNLISQGDTQDKPKDWYLRAHHIETLTEHPFSQKDNVMDTKYATFLQSLPKNNAFTQSDEVQQSQETKQQLIDSLEGKIGELKKDLVMQKYKSQSHVNNQTQQDQQQKSALAQQESQKFDQIQRYYDSIQKNEKKELLSGTYQSLLDDLRQQEKNLLNMKRGNEITSYGPPKQKWWEDKTSDFNANLKKYGQQLSQKKNQYDDIYQSLSVKELY